MKKVLAVTVGGEPDPLIRVISTRSPDFVIFFATTEPGGGSRRYVEEDTEKGPSIVSQTSLSPNCYKIVEIRDPDDFEDCFSTMYQTLQGYQNAQERWADYTGGTKTMSAALVLSALLLGWELSLVTGPRRDTVKVQKGTEVVRRVHSSPFQREFVLRQVQLLYDHNEFASAADVLEDFLATVDSDPDLTKLHAFLRALALWDRFCYPKAYEIMRTAARIWPKGCELLARLMCEASYVAVGDLLGNALRRAKQERYEDAVLRLYRAVELLAQVHFRLKHNQDTSDLDLSRLKLPQDLAEELRKRKESEGKAWVGLRDAYRVLEATGDPLGSLVGKKWKEPLLDLQFQRNQLLLAHGTSPITKEGWERAQRIAFNFIEEAQKVLRENMEPVIFPAWEELKLA